MHLIGLLTGFNLIIGCLYVASVVCSLWNNVEKSAILPSGTAELGSKGFSYSSRFLILPGFLCNIFYSPNLKRGLHEE